MKLEHWPYSRPGAKQCWSRLPAVAAVMPKPASDRPSIAVLPFTNMSGDSAHVYFSDGFTEDIITELSSFHELAVVARNATFRFRGQAVDVRAVGRELKARNSYPHYRAAHRRRIWQSRLG
jgi:TolB-like protein